MATVHLIAVFSMERWACYSIDQVHRGRQPLWGGVNIRLYLAGTQTRRIQYSHSRDSSRLFYGFSRGFLEDR